MFYHNEINRVMKRWRQNSISKETALKKLYEIEEEAYRLIESQKSVSGNGNSVLIPDRQRENKEAKLFFHYHPEAAVRGDFTLPAVAPIIRVMNRSLGIDIKR